MTSGAVVLVIEDEAEIADLLRMAFEREGFRIIHATDGESGHEKMGDRDPRVVPLDGGLPGIDGFEVCRRIRSVSDVPIIMPTAQDAEIDTIVGLEIGASDSVTKPCSVGELAARIKVLLRRSEQAPVPRRVLDIGGFAIDGGRREVTLPDGSVLRPTAREFDLLWYLAEHAGLVLSHGQILEAVWGYDYFGETRTVDVHVRQLRKKLEGLPLEMVWGVGHTIAVWARHDASRCLLGRHDRRNHAGGRACGRRIRQPGAAAR